MSCVEDDYECAICTSVQIVHLSTHTSLAVVETKIELNSHADTCVVGDHCLILHDHNRPLNVYGYDPTAELKHACIVDAPVAYTKPETGQVVILLLNQMIEMKGIDHHLLCSMQCCVNGVLIDEVPKFLEPIPSETMHDIQIENPFELKLKESLVTFTSYFEVRKLTQEEYEDQDILEIELMAKAPLWDPSSPEYSYQEQSMFNYRGQFVSPNTPARGQLFINSVTPYAYDATDVMDDDNYISVGQFCQYLIIANSTNKYREHIRA